MNTMTPCSHPDSNVALVVNDRAIRHSPAYVPETSLRDAIPVSRRSLLLVAAAGALAGILWAALSGAGP
jgi:hypothetical protein